MLRKHLTVYSFIWLILSVSCASKSGDYSPEVSQDGKFYYEMGVSSLNAGNNAQAISYLLKAIQTYKQPQVYNALALAYQFSGEYPKAEEIFKEGLARFDGNPELMTNLGVLYALTNREKQAITFLEKAASHPTYPSKDKAYYNLAVVYKNLGNETLFLEYINKSLMYNSNSVNPYLALGDYYFEKFGYTNDRQQLRFAVSNYLKAVNLGLNSPEVYYKIGSIYASLGERDLAKYYLEKGLKSVSDQDPLKNRIKQLLIELTEK